MEPHGRDENLENILEDMIRGDVTKQFLNDSDGWGEIELSGSNEGEAHKREAGGSGGTLNIANSDEVHIYIY